MRRYDRYHWNPYVDILNYIKKRKSFSHTWRAVYNGCLFYRSFYLSSFSPFIFYVANPRYLIPTDGDNTIIDLKLWSTNKFFLHNLLTTKVDKFIFSPQFDGFEICDTCRGYGVLITQDKLYYSFCNRCNGTGIIRWIDKMFFSKGKSI